VKSIKTLTECITKFRDERDWKQFHNPKDVALSLVLEASELLELFQWKNQQDVVEYAKNNHDEIGKELADVLYWVLLMSHDLNIDIAEALKKKLVENAKKYPVEKAKGSYKKYSEL
jgi:NTP pyrophosphatase (non-canonical NTP hydrolase)